MSVHSPLKPVSRYTGPRSRTQATVSKQLILRGFVIFDARLRPLFEARLFRHPPIEIAFQRSGLARELLFLFGIAFIEIGIAAGSQQQAGHKRGGKQARLNNPC